MTVFTAAPCRNLAFALFAILLQSLVPGARVSAQNPQVADAPPAFDPERFISGIEHPFLPLPPGRTFLYEGPAGEATERVELVVTHETRNILGVSCTVVRDRVYRDGLLVEDTDDWLAQDVEGNIWYFGEESRTVANGKVTGTEGSWIAGAGGAVPGILMPGLPEPGAVFRQEAAPGRAEDMVRILSLDAPLTIGCGKFDGCLKTEEWNPLEPGGVEFKYYAPGLGLVAERLEGADAGLELIAVIDE